jgi:hypothetical protein
MRLTRASQLTKQGAVAKDNDAASRAEPVKSARSTEDVGLEEGLLNEEEP